MLSRVGRAKWDGRWVGPARGLPSGIYTSRGFEAYHYDTDGRRIQSYATGYNTGRKDSYYDYAGAVVREKYAYPAESGLPDMEKTYSYTSTGLPLAQTVTTSPWPVSTPPVPSDPVMPNSDPMSGSKSGPASGDTSAGSDVSGIIVSVPTASITRRYDRLGRVCRLCLGHNATVDYQYDLHGWPTSQTLTCADTVMVMTLAYHDSARPRYNGFVSRKDWNGQSYLYEYDGLGRLTKAGYTAASDQSSSGSSPGNSPDPSLCWGIGLPESQAEDFSTAYEYDSRGNITYIRRKGITDRTGSAESFGTADNLSIDYTGNRMRRVDELDEGALPFAGNLQGLPGSAAGGGEEESGDVTVDLPDDFAYNEAGDLIRDMTRDIVSIRRTTEGRPSEVRFTDGHIQRTDWDMAGNRLCTRYLLETDAIALGGGLSPAEGGTASADTPGMGAADPLLPLLPAIHLYTRRYTGDGHVIRTEAADTGADAALGGGIIESIQFEGGYFDRYGKANYYVADYLGNVIAVVDEAGHLVQATDYYPYGLPFRMPASATVAPTPNRYLFGGKEFDEQSKEYDYFYRRYSPVIPAWQSIDPRAEKYYGISPYVAFNSNPNNYLDELGDQIQVVNPSSQEDIIQSINMVLGDKVKDFSFTENGFLEYHGDYSGLSKKQKKLLSSLLDIINDSEITNIISTNSTEININGLIIKNNSDGIGGGFTILSKENAVIKDGINYIVINPDVKTLNISTSPGPYFSPIKADGTEYETETYATNIADMFFHELGHVIFKDTTQDKVIDYNNLARKIMGMKPRPYDGEHNKLVKVLRRK